MTLPSTKQKTYFAYIRVSTTKQGEGTSLQEQKEAISRYADRHGLSIGQWLEEKETAAKRGRPVFSQMLRELRQGKASGVILHKIDRGARNLKDWADLGELIDEGIEVRFAHDDLDLHSRGGRLSADIQAVVAADYIRNLREETRKGFYGRIKQGLYPLPAPVGYLDKGKGIKEPHPLYAALVREAFELYAAGKHGLDSLVEKMYELGLRNKRGGRVVRNGMSCLLHNLFYIGLIRIRSTNEVFPGGHPPLVSKYLFDRVQDMLAGKNQEKVHRHFFLFRKLITCDHCGYKLIGEHQKGHTYYRCHTTTCPQKTVREENVEQALMQELKTIQFTELENQYFRQKIKGSYQQVVQFREIQIKALRLQLDQIKDRISKLTDAYIDGVLEKETYLEKKNALIIEEKEIKERLASLDHGEEKVLEKIEQFLELANNAHLSYKSAAPEQKRDLIKVITSNLKVNGKNVIIELQFPFQVTSSRPKLTDGAPYRDVPRTLLDDLFERLYKHFSTGTEVLQV